MDCATMEMAKPRCRDSRLDSVSGWLLSRVSLKKRGDSHGFWPERNLPVAAAQRGPDPLPCFFGKSGLRIIHVDIKPVRVLVGRPPQNSELARESVAEPAHRQVHPDVHPLTKR